MVIENLQAVPRFSGGRHIDERKKNPGNDLKHEAGQSGAAENIEPTCGLARHRMPGGFPNRRTELKALIEPAPRLSRSGAWSTLEPSAVARRDSPWSAFHPL